MYTIGVREKRIFYSNSLAYRAITCFAIDHRTINRKNDWWFYVKRQTEGPKNRLSFDKSLSFNGSFPQK